MSDQKLHPVIMAAAGAVILACGVAVAHMAGWIGGSKTDAAEIAASVPAAVAVASVPASVPAQVAVATPAPTVAPAPVAAAKPKHSGSQRATSHNKGEEYASNQPQEPAKQVCAVCGQVTSVQAIKQEGQSSGGGAVAGGLVGGLLGNQVGNGRGRTLATVVGAVGGAVAGNSVEKHVRSETDYQVHVQMDDGSTRTFTYKQQQPAFSTGQRVRVSGDSLVAD
ncbi:outer membrane lipoprotein SlyB [Silvimonas terrae]|uniref:Outer membrane lipoprotein SlyB n=1 Tax=Silvimonas terrae TaxID=300266 RepID=A0A840RG54_9NEIS|nr:glycine zipper 2TM domain-containing protein [Silvimonas terrae]MBB5191564.1 outer membrane lipoprotein SlyB [Silvimonas terrae]